MSVDNDTLKIDGIAMQHQRTVRERPRLHGLDGLRGIGALMVVLFHLTENHLIPRYRIIENGHLFVLVFFVLSGVVIRLSTSHMKPFRIGPFMQRRFARIWPLHATILLFMFAFHITNWFSSRNAAESYLSHDHSLSSFVASLLLLQSLGLYGGVVWNGPSWSISVEFYTYMIFALMLRLSPRRANLGFLFIVVASGLVIAGYGGLAALPYRFIALYCFVGFFSGTLLYEWVADRPTLNRSPRENIARQIALVSTFLLCLTFYNESQAMAVPFLISALLLIGEITRDRGFLSAVLSSRPMQFFGAVSYSLYLSHIPLLNVFTRLRDVALVHSWISTDAALSLLVPSYFAALLFISWALYNYVEVPARSWLMKGFSQQ